MQAGTDAPAWAIVILAIINCVQTIALAFIASSRVQQVQQIKPDIQETRKMREDRE